MMITITPRAPPWVVVQLIVKKGIEIDDFRHNAKQRIPSIKIPPSYGNFDIKSILLFTHSLLVGDQWDAYLP